MILFSKQNREPEQFKDYAMGIGDDELMNKQEGK